MSAYLQFDQVSKHFPGVIALGGVSFEAHAGTVHGLLGENGAGKSTLLKILGGQYRPDGGRLLLGGQEVRFASSSDAIAAGVAIIHQELQYVPELTVAENVLLGRLPTRFGLLDKREAQRLVSERLAKIGVDLDPAARLADLSIAQRQMVEICKAVMQDAQVIAFDEPTSSLSHRETDILFRLVKDLRAQGRTLIYISHRLEELYALCDACTIFRDGRKVATHPVMAEVPRERLISDMVGRELSDIYDYRERPHGAERLQVSGLAPDCDFTVRGGEVLGFFGLVGAGRSELMRSCMGPTSARPASAATLLPWMARRCRRAGRPPRLRPASCCARKTARSRASCRPRRCPRISISAAAATTCWAACFCATSAKRRWPTISSRACASRPPAASRKSACSRAATSKR